MGEKEEYVEVEYRGNPDDRLDEAMLSGVRKAKANLKKKKNTTESYLERRLRVLDRQKRMQEHAQHDQTSHGNWARGLNKKIKGLKPGGRVELEQKGDTKIFAERTGKGDRYKVVEETPDGFRVLRDSKFPVREKPVKPPKKDMPPTMEMPKAAKISRPKWHSTDTNEIINFLKSEYDVDNQKLDELAKDMLVDVAEQTLEDPNSWGGFEEEMASDVLEDPHIVRDFTFQDGFMYGGYLRELGMTWEDLEDDYLKDDTSGFPKTKESSLKKIHKGLRILEHADHDDKSHGNWARGTQTGPKKKARTERGGRNRLKRKAKKAMKKADEKERQARLDRERGPKKKKLKAPDTWEEDSGKVSDFLLQRYGPDGMTKEILNEQAQKFLDMKVHDIIDSDGEGVTSDALEKAHDLVDSNPDFPEGFTFEDVYDNMTGVISLKVLLSKMFMTT
jgi:hypothetical protein